MTADEVKKRTTQPTSSKNEIPDEIFVKLVVIRKLVTNTHNFDCVIMSLIFLPVVNISPRNKDPSPPQIFEDLKNLPKKMYQAKKQSNFYRCLLYLVLFHRIQMVGGTDFTTKNPFQILRYFEI